MHIFVKPAPGIKVRDPHTRQHLPEEGKQVPVESYWLRRIADGDVLEVVKTVDEGVSTKKVKE